MVCRSPKECDFSLQIVPLCDVVREEGIRSDAYTSTSKIVVFKQMNDEVSRLKFIIIQNGDEWHVVLWKRILHDTKKMPKNSKAAFTMHFLYYRVA